ncbi:glycoside hydrolase family 2 TIM barrel-domain containing protein [Paenibacillus sp. NRS-1760]|uniref:glycoside hydrolase family 2 TIM barrel-domain containing protein n=1 Tax=Paenibacillus sp. NRS-1760 TaxID=3233902 RepID=UPI003D28370A
MGKPNLYDVQIRLMTAHQELDQVKGRIGIREVRMERNPGFNEDEVEFPWTFIINGKRHFLRSACWGGQPSFLYGRNDDAKYEHLLRLAKECHINNLRIFGWHPPEIPKFYELCDELGISVWTNFPLATQVYPDDPPFVEATCRECVEIVKQRRNHPSNIYWMGGEEVFFTDGHFKSKNKELMQAVGEAIQAHTSVPYGLATPLSNDIAVRMGFKRKESKHANGHYYSGGKVFMEDYFPNIDAAIIPELTAASSPSVESLKKFIPPDELWPMGPSWGYHWADIDFLKGLNLEVFGDMRMDSLEEFVTATQIAQGTAFQFALELFRRRKPRVSGVSLCHFITQWPDMKWGIVDYYGKEKISYDFVKRSYEPLLASLAFAKRRWKHGEQFVAELWLVNDYQQPFKDLEYEWTILNRNGLACHGGIMKVEAESDSSCMVGELDWTIDLQAEKQFTVQLQLREESGQLISMNEYVLLIGDQAEAKAVCEAYARESALRREKWGRSYYRYELESWKLE